MLYRIDLAYIGTAYQGWQSQANGQGIQDKLEHALSIMLRQGVRVTGAARTDSGVHAENQVVTFETDLPFEQKRWLASLNGILSRDIGVKAVYPAPEGFHPVYAAKAKAYRYRLWLGVERNPFVTQFCWQVNSDLDLRLMRDEAKSFIGTHDFTSFCAKNASAKTRERTIFAIEFECKRERLVDIWVLGNGFLKQMVRTMVGTLVEVGRGKIGPGEIEHILNQRDRVLAGDTAPPQGLCLVDTFYEDVPQLGELIALAEGGFSFDIS